MVNTVQLAYHDIIYNEYLLNFHQKYQLSYFMCLNYLWHRTLPNWKLYQETWKRDVIKIAIIDTEFLCFTEIALKKIQPYVARSLEGNWIHSPFNTVHCSRWSIIPWVKVNSELTHTNTRKINLWMYLIYSTN